MNRTDGSTEKKRNVFVTSSGPTSWEDRKTQEKRIKKALSWYRKGNTNKSLDYLESVIQSGPNGKAVKKAATRSMIFICFIGWDGRLVFRPRVVY